MAKIKRTNNDQQNTTQKTLSTLKIIRLHYTKNTINTYDYTTPQHKKHYQHLRLYDSTTQKTLSTLKYYDSTTQKTLSTLKIIRLYYTKNTINT